MPYNKVYTVLLFLLFTLSNSKSVAQIGQHGEDWQNFIAKDSSLFFIAISKQSTLLTCKVRSKKNEVNATMLYYLDSVKTIEKIYISAFNAQSKQFLEFIEDTHQYNWIGNRIYSDKRIIHEFTGKEDVNRIGFAYYEGGLRVFTTQPKVEKLKGDYTFKERTR